MTGRSRFLLIALVPLLSGCFEDPIQETMSISFDEQRVATVSVESVIRSDTPNPPVRERVEEARRSFLEENDPWSRRFEALRMIEESYTRKKEDGDLTEIHRSARIKPDELSRLFADTAINAGYLEGPGWAELSLYAGESQRATREMRARYEGAIDGWSRDVAAYLSVAAEAYAYLQSNPDRNEAIFGPIFGDMLPEERLNSLPEPTEQEASLIERLEDRMSRVSALLSIDEGAAYAVDEISRLIHDPFPARLTVRVSGRIRETEGFVRDEDGLRVPAIGLWAALESLEGRWLTPDPLLLQVSHLLNPPDDSPFDFDGFLESRRSWQPTPSPGEIRSAIEAELERAAVYRVRWEPR